MDEDVPVRLGVAATAAEPHFYAKLRTACWAIPMLDPLQNNYPQNVSHFGDIGIMGSQGFSPKFLNQEIAFIFGLCKGVFFHNDVVRVIRWPWSRQPPGHDYKWCAVGAGMLSVWADGGAPTWTIQQGEWIDGTPTNPHTIVEPNDVGSVGAEQFPGSMTPLALDDITLIQGKPVQFKWCGAEGLFYPVVQAPDGAGAPPPP